MGKKIVYFDMDGVLCQFRKKFKECIADNPKIQYPQATYGFFADLEPHSLMVGLYKALVKNGKYHIHILTAPSYKNPLCYTEKRVWVEKYLGIDAAERMIISRYKHLLVGDFLIDDNASGKGQDYFGGKLLLVDEDNMRESVFKIVEALDFKVS